MTFKKLFKYTTKGQVQEWQIFVENDKFYTVEGIVGGKLTTSLPTVCLPKNVGKKNETSGFDQALREASSKFKKKMDTGYNPELTVGKNYVDPMLAEKFEDRKDLLFTERTFVQPKLDGVRCDNFEQLTSKNGKKFVTCPHLVQSETRLDGELYNHTFKDDFNKIISLVRKTKPTKEDIADAKELVQFWAYDFPNHKDVFSERYKALVAWSKTQTNESIRIVPTYEVFSLADIEKYHEQFLEEGFEGTIVRIDLGEYENKRSKQLLKYKDFIDSEFEIVGVEEGVGGRVGTIGKFIIKHDTIPDETFKSNVKGDFNYLREIWKNRDSYIGKTATIKYFKRTPDNIPRFPYVIKINREEYE